MIEKSTIADIASHVRKILKISDDEIIDIENVLKNLGIELVEDESLNYDGKIEVNNGKVTIFLKDFFYSNGRRRFTIAHELGHFFLHLEGDNSYKDSVFYRNLNYNQEEFEANEFAACLLMPENHFKSVARQNLSNENIYDIESIATHFKVSRAAAINRGRFLNEFE